MLLDNPLPFVSSVNAIHRVIPENLRTPRVGIICGSGLSGLVEAFRDVVLVPYESIPGFAQSSVPGHKSSLAFGLMGSGEGIPVVAMLGRFHPYEGHKLATVTYPVRVMAKLGIKDLIITNAAGGLNPKLSVGTIIVIQDHLALPNLTGLNPLIGPLISPEYARFVPLSDAYSPRLRRLAFLAANELELPSTDVEEGVYAWVSGPTYESIAEGRFLRSIGADVVGMSTVPEVLVARHEGLEVMALSLITNAVVIPEEYRSIKEEVAFELAGLPVNLPAENVVSHKDVLEAGQLKGQVMKQLVESIVGMIANAQ